MAYRDWGARLTWLLYRRRLAHSRQVEPVEPDVGQWWAVDTAHHPVVLTESVDGGFAGMTKDGTVHYLETGRLRERGEYLGNMYDMALKVTDEAYGDGAFAEYNAGDPDPDVRAAIQRRRKQ